MTTRAPKQVLVVDDDEVFCQSLARALERRGCAVVPVYGVGDALEAAGKTTHAVVDLRIGEDSGLALIERLVGMHPELRILILTGYASIATAVEAIKLGAIHYLTKPAGADEILAAFERGDGNAAVRPVARPMSVNRLEWEHLQRVLMEHDGNISAAARALGMHRRTLQRKLQKRPVRT